MKSSRIKSYALIGLAGFFLGGSYSHAQSVSSNRQKVVIYPVAGETIKQLKQQGIDKVESYGSFWVANTDEQHFKALQATRGKYRVVNGDYLNHIELRATGIDTSLGVPAVPAGMQQGETTGKRLRLIQFRGPIKPSWLDQVKAAGNIRIVSYIPNSAYIVWLDADAEQKLAGLMDPKGPIQWMGAYHPYYKVPQELLSASGNALIKVRVGVVDQSQDPQAASGVPALGLVNTSSSRNGQKIIEMDVMPSAINAIAQLPDVLWIETVVPQRVLDEVQDLVLATQTNGPGHGPSSSTGITNYLDFLSSSVAGGMMSFYNPSTYPVVDIADTGLDTGDPNGLIAHPAFYNSGNTNFGTRVAYMQPPWIGGNPRVQLGCTTRIVPALRGVFFNLEAADLDGHGTFVASIVTGYDEGTNILDRQILVFVTTSNTVPVTVPGPEPGNIGDCSEITKASADVTLTFNSGFTNFCGAMTTTNITFTISTNSCPTNFTTIVAYTRVVTNTVTEIRKNDSTGLHYGLGVSPFGTIGIDRVWGTMEDATFSILTISGGPCLPQFLADSLCINDLSHLVELAYIATGRIQNNSWADLVDYSQGGPTIVTNRGIYSAESQLYDFSVRDAIAPATNIITSLNQEFIIVFACNSALGDAASQGGAGGFADMLITPPATAKNVISVGSSVNPQFDCGGGDSLQMSPISSPGPTADQRFKPEIVAPGQAVVGAADQLAPSLQHPTTDLSPTNCEVIYLTPSTPAITNGIFTDCSSSQLVYTALYQCRSGSSYAAPAISGGIQLLWWYFENRLTNEVGRALSQPSPAIAKAYLCNAARYLPVIDPQTGAKDTLPSMLQGMGEMDLQRMFDGVGRVIRDESTPRAINVPLVATNRNPQQTFFSQSGQSYEVRGQIQSNGLPFRVTLAWTDAPGSPEVFQQLVNDLDLEVAVGGQKYRGNNFSEDHSIPNGGFDRINNMESVFLPPGQTGAWTVVVTAQNIAGNGVPNVGNGLGQDFALVVYNSLTNFSSLTDVPNLATNNACQTALPITTFPYVFANVLTNTVYNNAMISPSAATGAGGIDEFFKIETPSPGITFSVDTSASSFNSVLSVWRVTTVPNTLQSRGECGFLEELVSEEVQSTNGGGGGAVSPLSFTSDGSNTYFIVVEPQNNGGGGTMVLNVDATGTGINISPSQLNFGDQISGTTSTPQTVTYQRVNPGAVTINSVSIVGADPSDFEIDSQNCSGRTLNNGGSCSVTVSFTPQTTNLLQAILMITDDGTGSPRLIPLSGIGTPAAPLICLGLGSSSELVFSNTAVGATSAPQTITLTNCGTAPLAITNVIFRTGATNDFSVVQNCTNALIAPGGTCSLTVTFTPTVAGTRLTTLSIFNTSFANIITIPCTGTGFTPVPAFCASAGTINFGNVDVGTTGLAQSVTITNCGTAALTISNVTVTGANAGDFVNISLPCSTLPTGATCVVGLQFAPTAGGARSANLTFTDNAAGSPQLIALVGSGNLSAPDASVGKNTNLKKFVGRGVVNTSGIGQELVQKVRRGARKGVKYYVALQNIGTANDRFFVQGDPSSDGFTVNYFLGAKPRDSVDVTAAVEAGTFSTSTMAPGAITGDTSMIRVEVFADKILVAKGTTKTFTLTFSSAADPTRQDTVRVTAIAR